MKNKMNKLKKILTILVVSLLITLSFGVFVGNQGNAKASFSTDVPDYSERDIVIIGNYTTKYSYAYDGLPDRIRQMGYSNIVNVDTNETSRNQDEHYMDYVDKGDIVVINYDVNSGDGPVYEIWDNITYNSEMNGELDVLAMGSGFLKVPSDHDEIEKAVGIPPVYLGPGEADTENMTTTFTSDIPVMSGITFKKDTTQYARNQIRDVKKYTVSSSYPPDFVQTTDSGNNGDGWPVYTKNTENGNDVWWCSGVDGDVLKNDWLNVFMTEFFVTHLGLPKKQTISNLGYDDFPQVGTTDGNDVQTHQIKHLSEGLYDNISRGNAGRLGIALDGRECIDAQENPGKNWKQLEAMVKDMDLEMQMHTYSTHNSTDAWYDEDIWKQEMEDFQDWLDNDNASYLPDDINVYWMPNTWQDKFDDDEVIASNSEFQFFVSSPWNGIDEYQEQNGAYGMRGLASSYVHGLNDRDVMNWTSNAGGRHFGHGQDINHSHRDEMIDHYEFIQDRQYEYNGALWSGAEDIGDNNKAWWSHDKVTTLSPTNRSDVVVVDNYHSGAEISEPHSVDYKYISNDGERLLPIQYEWGGSWDTVQLSEYGDDGKKVSFEAEWSGDVSVERPESWTEDSYIVVKNEDTGEEVDWRKGSITFNVTSGTTYTLSYEDIEYQMTELANLLIGVIPLVVIIFVVKLVMGAIGGVTDDLR